MFNLSAVICISIVALLEINIIKASSRNADILKEPKIINGTIASLDATKHQVSIRKRVNDDQLFGSGHTCGGSLISENVVLSAAHCFLDNSLNGSFAPDNDFIVVMGNIDRFERNNNTLTFDILKVVKPTEFFNFTTLATDIVLVILNGTVPAEHPTVKPIILNDGPLKNNTVCQATGWGMTEEGGLSRMLRTVDVPIIDFSDCRKKTKYGAQILEGMLCAGYLKGERDSCTADSGGPLVCRGIQAGIVSWGFGCAIPLYPGVYTDVAYYNNWILKQVANNNGTVPKFAPIPDEARSLSCSIFLIGFMLIFNYIYSRTK